MTLRRISPRPVRRGVLALLAVALSACASSGGSGRPAEAFSTPTTIRVIVQNLNFQDARLYTYRAGVRSFLGVVRGKTNAEYVLDWNLPQPMYMELDLLAGPRCFTDEMMVEPTDIIELQIASDFFQTSTCRRTPPGGR